MHKLIKQNDNRAETNASYWKNKTLVVVFFFLAILIWTCLNMDDWGTKFLGISIWFWIFGFIISFLFAYFSHFLNFFNALKIIYKIDFPYKGVTNALNIKGSDLKKITKFSLKTFVNIPFNENDVEIKNSTLKLIINKSKFKNILYTLFSPDYFYAKVFKLRLSDNDLNVVCKKRQNKKDKLHKCELTAEEPALYTCELQNKKDRRRDFIIFSNWTNVAISLVLVFLAILATYLHENKIAEWLMHLLFAIILFRTMSRVIEIIVAYYIDIVRTKMKKDSLEIGHKSSSLKRGHRLSLAVHSYAEVAIIFSGIYFMSMELGYFYTTDSSDMKTFLDFLLYSLSVSAFNFSFTSDFTTFQKLVHISQVFTNITLVVLSVATYIGMKDEMSDIEKFLWKKYT